MKNTNKLNILFLYSNVIDPIKGGIENVTSELAHYFISQGCSCYYISLNNSKIDDKKQYYLPNESSFLNKENEIFLINFIKEKNIDILINQDGFHKECSQFAYIAKTQGVKLISCIHHQLIDRIKHFEVFYYNIFKKHKLQLLLKIAKYNFIKNILYSMYRLKYQKHFKEMYKHSDSVILLSDSFRQDLSFFVKDTLNKVCVIPNPIPFKIYNSEANNQKEKILLYVGRFCETKRVDFLLQIWSLIHKKHQDWKLIIVGGAGKELNLMKKYACSLGLTNVFFEGVQDPIKFYQKASIFCMTSVIEAFGIVLIEAMNMKVIPFAFNSFSTVNDIIDHNINGILIPPFNKELYAEKLSELMSNDNIRCEFCNNAYIKSLQFQMDMVGRKWLTLFSYLA